MLRCRNRFDNRPNRSDLCPRLNQSLPLIVHHRSLQRLNLLLVSLSYSLNKLRNYLDLMDLAWELRLD